MTIEEMKKPVATHEQVAERLKALMEGPQDVSKLPVVYHRALDVTLYVGPLSGPQYEGWQAQKFIEEQRHKQSGAAENQAPLSTTKSDAFLLQNAVWTGDGRNLDSATVETMQKAPQCGASNFELLQAAKRQNPPREQLSAEFAVLFACAQTTAVLWELLFKIGKGGALVDAIAPAATPEEKAQAEHEIKKAQQAVYGLAPFLDTKRAASALGITLEQAAQHVAFEAIEQVKQAAA